ncbi:MAG: hypothetical protein II797_03385, partial [Clostridia bacterium]|nr:hypothetical protein [Clostridia bacterium]
YEIQTSSFTYLRRKLEVFLNSHSVTVIYPVAKVKYLSWIDPEGTVSGRRKSPKTGTAAELLPNLVYLLPVLGHPNLRFTVILLEVDEFRLKDGWANGGKRGSHRLERIPLSLLEIREFSQKEDFLDLLPKELGNPFTAKDFSAKTRFSTRKTSAALKALTTLGVLRKIQSDHRKVFYEY